MSKGVKCFSSKLSRKIKLKQRREDLTKLNRLTGFGNGTRKKKELENKCYPHINQKIKV